ncbi:SirB1 family protein [Salisaeta longa]|uniref:SirB1 family protein n=1 Tax=Salisaeta longa TaxID=503170 RepID=UPI0003B7A08F|nr:transglutaminase-like domain-containing protein [Salisaeta longa]
MSVSSSELEALIALLDDSDRAVQEAVEARFNELGRAALPALRAARERVDAGLADRVEALARRLHWQSVRDAWHAVMEQAPVDLERATFLLALYRFPDLDIGAYQQRLDRLAEAVRPRVEQAQGVRRAAIIARFLFDEQGFQGNRRHYFDANNSYINRVLDRQLGIPISLSVLFLLVAQRLNVPVYGVNLPAHFLVKYMGPGGDAFFDPFSEGERVTQQACMRFLVQAGVEPTAEHFQAADPQAIVLRMARNLLIIAQENDQPRMTRDLRALMAPYDPDVARLE